MSFLLWHRQGAIGIASTRQVLRAAEVPLLSQANELCQRLQAIAAAEAGRVDAACADARRDGYQAGFAEGIAAAAEEHATRLIALAEAAARHRETLAAQVAGLALEVARKMVGSLAAGERLVALATTATQDLLPGEAMTLHVHPDQLEAVRNRLASLVPEGEADPQPDFDVRADGDCSLDACRIETGLGSVDASLETQLQRLAAAWGVAADSEEAA